MAPIEDVRSPSGWLCCRCAFSFRETCSLSKKRKTRREMLSERRIHEEYAKLGPIRCVRPFLPDWDILETHDCGTMRSSLIHLLLTCFYGVCVCVCVSATQRWWPAFSSSWWLCCGSPESLALCLAGRPFLRSECRRRCDTLPQLALLPLRGFSDEACEQVWGVGRNTETAEFTLFYFFISLYL